MNWFKRKFAQWSKEAWENAQKENVKEAKLTVDPFPQEPPNIRFAIRKAINGRFIEISTYSPQQRGSDWVTEYYLVPEDKTVSEALTVLTLMKGAG